MMIQHAIYAFLVVGLFATLGFMGRAGETEEVYWWLLVGPLGAWVGFPYAVVAMTTRRVSGARVSLVLLLGVSVAVVVSTTAILWSAFVTDEDAQSGRLFLILPVYQLAVWGPSALVAYWLKVRADSKAGPE